MGVILRNWEKSAVSRIMGTDSGDFTPDLWDFFLIPKIPELRENGEFRVP